MKRRRWNHARLALTLPGALVLGALVAPGGSATAETGAEIAPTAVVASSATPVTSAQEISRSNLNEDIDPVRNLKVTGLKVDPVKLTTKVSITWEPPEEGYIGTRYRVLYSTDWRPQKWYKLETSKESAVLKNLWPGRSYTIAVQATGTFVSGWGMPDVILVETQDCELLSRNPRCPVDDPASVPWVVSLGDSFISGEAGRWAGNSDDKDASIDAAGQERAYFDYEDGEIIRGCHRSNAAVVHLLVTKSMNLACSGAITTSAVGQDNYKAIIGLLPFPDMWKPGIDFADFTGRPELPDDVIGPAVGQAKLLQDFATGRDVRMVMLSIGGNNFGFGSIVSGCTKLFIEGDWRRCKDNPLLTAGLRDDSVAITRAEITDAIGNIVTAMENAGHPPDTWVLGYQMYPRPIATGGEMRYGESGLTRQSVGGCGMWDADANWAVDTAVTIINGALKDAAEEAVRLTPGLKVVFLDTTNAFASHELCHKLAFRVDQTNDEDRKGVKSWRSKGASDRSEWVKEIDLLNTDQATIEESFHPNYWGQLAMRNCWRQLYTLAAPRRNVEDPGLAWRESVQGGSCQPLSGLNSYNEPNMYFEVDPALTLDF